VNVPARVINDPRIIDMESQRVEIICDHIRVGLLAIHAKCECFNSAEKEESIYRGKRVANGVDCKRQLLFAPSQNCKIRHNTVKRYLGYIIPITDYNTRHEVMVSAKILGSAVVHDIGAMFQRPL
jgi:hypothetical protein